MFTRAELEFKSRACLAQMNLRVVVFSMALGLPLWIGGYTLQKLGLAKVTVTTARGVGAFLLIVYAVGVARILRRTPREHGLVCPKCDRSLGAQLKNITADGKCSSCDEPIVKSPGY